VAEEATINMMIQYGIAGIVIYLLFRIVFNDLHSVKSELREIRKELRRIREALENSNTTP
jgi:hypothetical protein